MLLLNVIFFNGLWTNPFNENETKLESFYLNDRQYIQTSMMKAQHDVKYAQTYDGDLQLLRLPYQVNYLTLFKENCIFCMILTIWTPTIRNRAQPKVADMTNTFKYRNQL